jgi:hypothetical protein
MCRHQYVSVKSLTALLFSLQMVGCGKTDNGSSPPEAVETAATADQAQKYRIAIQSNGKEIGVIDLLIQGDAATSTVADVTERFDLRNQRWQHDGSKEWVTLSECESWAIQSKDKSQTSSASVPEQIRPFVEWSLDPTFDVVSTNGILTLTSGQVDYKIAVERYDRDLANYYRYARLNAYKKAMTARKLPPFAELLVLDELERRNVMPKTMQVQIPGVPGSPVIEIFIPL